MMMQPGMIQPQYGFPPQMFPGTAPRMPMNPQMMGFAPNMLIEQFGQMALGMGPRPQTSFNKKEHKARMSQLPSIHVSNLPKENFLDLDLYKFFSSHGYKVKSAKVVLHNKTSKSLQYGYITFFSEADLERCLKEMNNFKLNGLPLCLTRSSSDPKAIQEEKKDANLLVKNISETVSQKDLFDLFSAKGKVLSCKLEHHPETGKSKGYAYIQFEQVEDANLARSVLNGMELNNKKLEIDVLKKKEGKTESEKIVKPVKSLFVKNFPQGTNEDGLAAIFRRFGEIESVKVETDDDGKLLNQGYVNFKEIDSAKNALETLQRTQQGDTFLIVNYTVSKQSD